MTEDVDFSLFEKLRQQAGPQTDQKVPLKSGDGGGTFDGMEARVKAFEDDMKKILQDTAEIKGMLRAAPSTVDFGEMKGRVNSLPTTAKVATIVGIAAGLVTILTRWNELSSLFGK
ncbi:hypothetical protein [Sinorhizobium sp. RAC02]|uniref:hypothetical protein n=1 Tax=Sinorhizobium sp. RAC02 TaxID=1842534 RepID=UPI00083DA3BD|nr:hypothetical protein [Sinorhizobium sp. RAC02]AOF91692.1 hypothetical protein BSY16_2312 [Sinorhizobium sp. RAC02]